MPEVSLYGICPWGEAWDVAFTVVPEWQRCTPQPIKVKYVFQQSHLIQKHYGTVICSVPTALVMLGELA